jgi:hypothetical protein
VTENKLLSRKTSKLVSDRSKVKQANNFEAERRVHHAAQMARRTTPVTNGVRREKE